MEADVGPAGATGPTVTERCAVMAELHDLVTHDLAQLTVQIAAARRLLPTDPETASRVLADAEATARTAVGGMRRSATLVPTPEGNQSRPQPGLGDLDELAAAAAVRGVTVLVHREAVPLSVPPAAGLAVFRLAEACLDGVIAAGTSTEMRLAVTGADGVLRLAVTGAHPDPELLGRKAGLYGAGVEYRPDGGITVDLPLERAPA